VEIVALLAVVVDESVLEVAIDEVEVAATELDVPLAAVPCIRRSVYPPSLQNVRVDAEIPVELGLKTSGIVREAPGAKVEPTAGKLVAV
jgi:hypothetical protein